MPENQPILAPEGEYTNLERYFIEESPQNWWPTNQNSNFGVFRRVITDLPQEAANLLDELFREMWIESAHGYLGLWEDQLGIPRGNAWPDRHRKSMLESRVKIAPFTRTRRRKLVEAFIQDTFGTAIQFTPEGIALVPEGVPLLADTVDISDAYLIEEDVENFYYIVYILNTVTPDLIGLNRELRHITPAHIEYEIDNTWDGTILLDFPDVPIIEDFEDPLA